MLHALYESSNPYGLSSLVVLGFNATLTAKVISWRSVLHMFPGFLTPVLTQLFFPKPPTTFLTCFSRGERQKYCREKFCLNRVSNSEPPGHESNTLITEPPRRGLMVWDKKIFKYFLSYLDEKSKLKTNNLVLIFTPGP